MKKKKNTKMLLQGFVLAQAFNTPWLSLPKGTELIKRYSEGDSGWEIPGVKAINAVIPEEIYDASYDGFSAGDGTELLTTEIIKKYPDFFTPIEEEVISIREAIKSKPSVALAHMVRGLEKFPKKPNFKIDMNTFGEWTHRNKSTNKYSANKTCYGCAATCTIQDIANKPFVNGEISDGETRADYLGFDYDELAEFEETINRARMGDTGSLFEFCDLEDKLYHLDDSIDEKKFRSILHPGFNLGTNNYKKQLPKVKTYIAMIKKLGF